MNKRRILFDLLWFPFSLSLAAFCSLILISMDIGNGACVWYIFWLVGNIFFVNTIFLCGTAYFHIKVTNMPLNDLEQNRIYDSLVSSIYIMFWGLNVLVIGPLFSNIYNQSFIASIGVAICGLAVGKMIHLDIKERARLKRQAQITMIDIPQYIRNLFGIAFDFHDRIDNSVGIPSSLVTPNSPPNSPRINGRIDDLIQQNPDTIIITSSQNQPPKPIVEDIPVIKVSNAIDQLEV